MDSGDGLCISKRGVSNESSPYERKVSQMNRQTSYLKQEKSKDPSGQSGI